LTDHITFLFFIILFFFSTIGYGELFSRLIGRGLQSQNIGLKGLFGFFAICLISLITSYFFPHNYIHNIVLHIFGIFGIIFYLINQKNNYLELKYISILLLILLIGSYVYKNHDDFPYYHLTYTLNLSENRFIIGTGIFSHGFRTFSSIFYYHSVLYAPLIKFYLFHIGPFFILVFSNFIFLRNIIINSLNKKIDFIYFFSLFSLIFINIIFYRIGEHGTDRSAQILLLIIFVYFLDIVFFEKKKTKVDSKISIILILIFLASSMKAIYYMYLILVPIIFYKKKYYNKFFKIKNSFIIFLLSLSLFGNLLTNYLNTGCILYPAEKTCVFKNDWSIPKKEVKKMSIHYEWWAKAGGGPGYRSDIKPEKYIKNFVWVENWIDKHFFNKVSDTLFGIIFICFLIYFCFRFYSKKINNQKLSLSEYIYGVSLPLIFLLEWFLNHPAMRYGGYVLVALPFFIYFSFKLSRIHVRKNMILTLTSIFLIITYSGYIGRNLLRINKETKVYSYDIIKSPFFYIEKINPIVIFKNENFKVFSPDKGKMCWASKTPCSYFKELSYKKLKNFNIVYRNDW